MSKKNTTVRARAQGRQSILQYLTGLGRDINLKKKGIHFNLQMAPTQQTHVHSKKEESLEKESILFSW